MQIKIVSLGPVTTKRGPKSSYTEVEITYKDVEGRTKNKKLFSFNKDVYAVLSVAEANQTYEIKMEKQSTARGEFWEWLSATKVEGAPEAVAAPAASGRGGGSYASKSADTDARIARAVALKAAIDYHAHPASTAVDTESIIETAAVFEVYLTNGYVSQDFKEVSKSAELPDDSDDILK